MDFFILEVNKVEFIVHHVNVLRIDVDIINFLINFCQKAQIIKEELNIRLEHFF